jgi:hypothetical protein
MVADQHVDKNDWRNEFPEQKPLSYWWYLAAVFLALLGFAVGAVLGDYGYLAANPRPTNFSTYRTVQTTAGIFGGCVVWWCVMAIGRSSRHRAARLAALTVSLVMLISLGVSLLKRQVAKRTEPAPEVERFEIPDHMFSNSPGPVSSSPGGIRRPAAGPLNRSN